MTDSPGKPLSTSAITHGWIRPVRHPELGVDINGQSVVRYLRFGRAVRVDRLELKPVIAGRWVPGVPTHPAHVTVSTLDAATGRWRLLKDVALPPDPRIKGLDELGRVKGSDFEVIETTGPDDGPRVP